MAGEEFDNHWNLLKWAVETLLTLKPGEYPPISYEQTYSAVYKCVCQGHAEELYRKLLEELERQLQMFSFHLQALPDVQLVEAFSSAWEHFNSGLSGIVPIFNYMARFYVEAKLNLNLRLELTKVFDGQVVLPILDRLIGQLRIAQNASFAVHPATMQNVVLALHKLRPEIANELTDLFRRFLPELVQQVHLDQLPDLQEEARRMMAEARSSAVEFNVGSIGAYHRSCPLSISGVDFDSSGLAAADASMDFQLLDDHAAAANGFVQVSDPVIMRRVKRARSRDESSDDGCEGVSGESGVQADPEEPSPSPRSLKQRAENQPQRKHFHGENVHD